MWYAVEEHMPEAHRKILGYSLIHGSYHLCFWTPASGWMDLQIPQLLMITHWIDIEFDKCFPFPIYEKISQEIAAQYGIKLPEDDGYGT